MQMMSFSCMLAPCRAAFALSLWRGPALNRGTWGRRIVKHQACCPFPPPPPPHGSVQKYDGRLRGVLRFCNLEQKIQKLLAGILHLPPLPGKQVLGLNPSRRGGGRRGKAGFFTLREITATVRLCAEPLPSKLQQFQRQRDQPACAIGFSRRAGAKRRVGVFASLGAVLQGRGRVRGERAQSMSHNSAPARDTVHVFLDPFLGISTDHHNRSSRSRIVGNRNCCGVVVAVVIVASSGSHSCRRHRRTRTTSNRSSSSGSGRSGRRRRSTGSSSSSRGAGAEVGVGVVGAVAVRVSLECPRSAQPQSTRKFPAGGGDVRSTTSLECFHRTRLDRNLRTPRSSRLDVPCRGAREHCKFCWVRRGID